jgi:predicted transcriptional regulator
MKYLSIIAIALFGLVALCSSVPVVNQQVEEEARLDIYNDFLAGLFSGLVSTTFTSVSNFFNQLISENPLGVGKRNAQDELAARVNIFQFLYDNILQELLTSIVGNTLTTATDALGNLIQTGIGKRNAQDELAARVNIFTFLYDNILQDLFSGIVTNTFTTATNAINNLIQTNPLGLGKRDVQGDLAARVDVLTFLYDNIFQQLFSGIVSNTFTTATNALNNLIQTNPLGIGKRAARLDVNIFQFLYDNIVAQLFGDLASNTASFLQNSLNDLLNKPFGTLGKRSVEIQQAQALVAQTVPILIQKFKTFAQQAVALWNDRQKLNQLVKDNIAEIKAIVGSLTQQLSQLIPSAIITEVSEVLATLQSVLVLWTSGLGGSLGPVILPVHA